MMDLVGKRYLFFVLSLIIIIPGLISLVFNGLDLSVEFKGGTLWDIQFKNPSSPLTLDSVRSTVAQAAPNYSDMSVQLIGSTNDGIELRLPELQKSLPVPPNSPAGTIAKPNPDYLKIKQALINKFAGGNDANFVEQTFNDVGPVIGKEISRNAIYSVGAASILILAYIWFAFRKVSSPWRFGLCAIFAMLHDVLVVVGVFSILGALFAIQVDALFVTGVLTVIGFSVHDTIVVFDRIRENALRRGAESFPSVVNHSLLQTVVRSINTSLTVLFTLLALYLLGGSTIHNFALTLLVGIASGTYSSIFNASMLLVAWENGSAERQAISRFFRNPFRSVDVENYRAGAVAGD